MDTTCTVTLKDRLGEKHRFGQVTSLNLTDDNYVLIDCENGSKFIFNHTNVFEIEIIRNK
jgi:hypothetical protein